jgi:Uncharacterized protein related to the periplasmic component of the Tol biopolymer transport system
MGWRALFHRSAAAAALSIGAVATTAFAQAETLLLRQPSLGERHIAFIYAGDVWVADRSGANPRRLTTHPADERQPHLSPDGAWIAFTSNAEQNADVYVVPVTGGQPKRLTFHPGADVAQGWTADGKVLFSSARAVNHGRSAQAYAIAPDATFPENAWRRAFSPATSMIPARGWRFCRSDRPIMRSMAARPAGASIAAAQRRRSRSWM